MQKIIVHSLLWLVASIRRHPWRWAVAVLVWLLWQMTLAEAFATGVAVLYKIAKRIAQMIGAKAEETVDRLFDAIANAYNAIFTDPARVWWLLLALVILLPPVGWSLLLWHVLDYLRPGPKLSVAPAPLESPQE